ncbi:MAG: CRISPR-associated endonuclease Cas1 [Candidatus Contendobacter sp.]|nr:CRISPR-associated endonuclease Cas1 [Candidatus Contendobacter sp.]MDS4060625.1 CRISPR-associated endonuclease Cas1 [Candidatus Contendobacter sp.]
MGTEFHGLLDEHEEGSRKPLYLQGRNGLAVELDGPALRVRQPERAAVFYPLARLARVLSKGGVRWTCDALLACADAGIPVVFLDGDGGVRGYLFGPSASDDDLYQRLRAYRRRADGPDRYADWRQEMGGRARRALAEQLRRAGAGPGPVLAWRGLAPAGAGAVLEATVWRRLHGLLAGLSAQLLVEAGLNAERLAHLEPLHLVDDVAELLGWALVAPLLTAGRGGGRPGPAWDDERELTALVEARREEVFQFGRLLLGCLQQWLEI